MDLAKHIQVDRDENGAPRITIDGQLMPWATNGIAVEPPSLKGMTALTLTILAEKITLDDRVPCSMNGISIYEDTDSVRSPGWCIASCVCGWETSGSEPVCEEAAAEHVHRSQHPEGKSPPLATGKGAPSAPEAAPRDDETGLAVAYMDACQEAQRRGDPLPDVHEFARAFRSAADHG